MARREYENKGGGLPEGLIFYAPLNVEGDLSDYIKGLSPTINAKTSIAWDSTYGGYRIKPSSYASSSGGNRFTTGIIYNIGWAPIIKSQEFSILYEIVQYKACVYSGHTKPGLCELIYSTANTVFLRPTEDSHPVSATSVLNSPVYIAATLKRSNGTQTIERYINAGNRVAAQGTYSSDMPSSLRLFVGNQFDGRSSYYNDAVFRNVMIFDRILTQNEIKQIQGIE